MISWFSGMVFIEALSRCSSGTRIRLDSTNSMNVFGDQLHMCTLKVCTASQISIKQSYITMLDCVTIRAIWRGYQNSTDMKETWQYPIYVHPTDILASSLKLKNFCIICLQLSNTFMFEIALRNEEKWEHPMLCVGQSVLRWVECEVIVLFHNPLLKNILMNTF